MKNVRISDVVAEVTVEDRVKRKTVYRRLKVDTTPGLTDDEKSKVGPIMIAGFPDHYVEDQREMIVLDDVENFINN